jgi:hypothetical protein
MIKKSNNRVQRTRHKVSGPLTRDVGSMKMKYILIALLVCAAMCTSAQEPVATVLGDKIHRVELMPSEKMATSQKADLSEEEFAQWQKDYPAERLSQLIHRPIMQKYMRENNLVVTDKDIVAYLNRGDEPIPDDILDKEGKIFFGSIIESLLFSKSLFEEYGGRVAISSFGFADAIDARETFLQQQAQNGTFVINDPDLQKAFWANITNDWLDGTLTEVEAREMFNRPGFPMDTE